MIRAYAEPKNGRGTPSTNATADDRAYTAWAQGAAAEAGVRNPGAYVNRNVAKNAGATSRNRTMSAINRRSRG